MGQPLDVISPYKTAISSELVCCGQHSVVQYSLHYEVIIAPIRYVQTENFVLKPSVFKYDPDNVINPLSKFRTFWIPAHIQGNEAPTEYSKPPKRGWRRTKCEKDCSGLKRIINGRDYKRQLHGLTGLARCGVVLLLGKGRLVSQCPLRHDCTDLVNYYGTLTLIPGLIPGAGSARCGATARQGRLVSQCPLRLNCTNLVNYYGTLTLIPGLIPGAGSARCGATARQGPAGLPGLAQRGVVLLLGKGRLVSQCPLRLNCTNLVNYYGTLTLIPGMQHGGVPSHDGMDAGNMVADRPIMEWTLATRWRTVTSRNGRWQHGGGPSIMEWTLAIRWWTVTSRNGRWQHGGGPSHQGIDAGNTVANRHFTEWTLATR
ncbi:hypothetical protein J6590_072216 [Homalodisca vitripennis]|nr:hypothetical protein J6590_072216 [Homalodisca vitripennis]